LAEVNMIVQKRYRTGLLDAEPGIVVKDNLNGMKSLKDKDDMSTFFNGKLSFTFSKDIYNMDKEKKSF
jgi:hypothetical protein